MGETMVTARVTHAGRVREIRLARPPVNVLNLDLLAALDGELAAAGEAIVVLRGEGKLFSAGVDVADHVPERVAAMVRDFHAVLNRLERIPAVTIAAVHGAALGGGLELALACDLALATADARLGLPEIRLGVFPPWAAARFPRRYPPAAVAELVLLGDEMTGERAHALGLVNRVTPPADFERAVEELVAALGRHSDAALRAAKRALAEGRQGVDALPGVERLYLEELMATHDAHEGLKAFMERRPPVWEHR